MSIPRYAALLVLISSFLAPTQQVDAQHPDTSSRVGFDTLGYYDEAPEPDKVDAPSLTEQFEEAAPACNCSECNGGPVCDCKKMKELAGKAAKAYKPLFYDNDFGYLCDPCYDDWHLGEELKRMCLGDCWVVDLGGQYRLRYQSEHNLRAKPLSGRDDDFLLHRTRLYANAEYGRRVRLYGEAIDATSNFQKLTPRGIEVNRFDALNLFGDFMIWEDGCSSGEFWARVGRQEMQYGAQRLVSPLDWSNTRRTFDGAKMFYKGKKWNIDGWWAKPVPFGQHIAGGRQDHNFDSPNDEQDFVGVWANYKSAPGRTADFYFLRLDDYSGRLRNANAQVGDVDWNLLGVHLLGNCRDWLYEVEGGYQFGDFASDNVKAGFYTLGIGRKFSSVRWTPTAWLYYDWASGDNNPLDNEVNTFNQYYPLGHKYLGFMDIIGRQNIQDLNVLLTMKPHEKLNLVFWYHRFWLQSETDALYNVGGAPIYQDPTGGSGNDVGQELDVLLQCTLTPRMNVWFGYSHFWTGNFFDSPVIQTPGTPAGGIATNGSNGQDADFFYTQFLINF